jgi:hypothetical protein
MEHQPVGVRRQSVGLSRVALLVDGDNLPSSLAGAMLDIAGRLGRVDMRRVYAAESGHKAWDQALGFRVVRVAGAKNGTDMLLCIEATEMACRGGFDHFVIASDDRDFSHLACWLREQGFPSWGSGRPSRRRDGGRPARASSCSRRGQRTRNGRCPSRIWIFACAPPSAERSDGS